MDAPVKAGWRPLGAQEADTGSSARKTQFSIAKEATKGREHIFFILSCLILSMISR